MHIAEQYSDAKQKRGWERFQTKNWQELVPERAMNIEEKEILDHHKSSTQIMKRMVIATSWLMIEKVVVFEKL